MYPASRHEEWVYGRWHDKPRLGISFSHQVLPSVGMAWTSLIRFHYSLFVADLKEEAHAPGCTHQMLRTVSCNLMLDVS